MLRIIIKNNVLNVILYDEILSSYLDNSQNIWGGLRPIEQPEILINFKEDKAIQCCSFSPSGDFFAVCYNKILIIYNVPGWETYCSGTVERKAVSVQFFPKSNVVLVADKSGCVTFYSYSQGNLTKKDLILGHNSMLTGALITNDERYVITSDRDEKIRISNYPNVYNIQSYCLGHEQFVSSINILPSDKRILMSGSGDGTIRFWDFVKGKELLQFNTNNKTEPIPITKILCRKDNDSSLVAALQYKSKHILLLDVKGNLDEGLSHELLNAVELSVEPWDITFWLNNIIIFLPDKTNPIQVWESNHEKSFNNIKKYLIDNYESIINQCNKISDLIPVLYKREIDNVQEYQERKKARLSKNKTNDIDNLSS